MAHSFSATVKVVGRRCLMREKRPCCKRRRRRLRTKRNVKSKQMPKRKKKKMETSGDGCSLLQKGINHCLFF